MPSQNMIRCHVCEKYFDSNKHRSCPYCADPQNPNQGVEVSLPFAGTVQSRVSPAPAGQYVHTVAMPAAVPVSGPPIAKPAAVPVYGPPVIKPAAVLGSGPLAAPLSAVPLPAAAPSAGSAYAPQPDDGYICGWLVCDKGPKRGGYFRLYQSKNPVGRKEDGFGAWDSECAYILYDDKNYAFWIINGPGRRLVRINGELLTGPQALRKGDRIEIGAWGLVFIPLCTEKFGWQG